MPDTDTTAWFKTATAGATLFVTYPQRGMDGTAHYELHTVTGRSAHYLTSVVADTNSAPGDVPRDHEWSRRDGRYRAERDRWSRPPNACLYRPEAHDLLMAQERHKVSLDTLARRLRQLGEELAKLDTSQVPTNLAAELDHLYEAMVLETPADQHRTNATPDRTRVSPWLTEERQRVLAHRATEAEHAAQRAAARAAARDYAPTPNT